MSDLMPRDVWQSTDQGKAPSETVVRDRLLDVLAACTRSVEGGRTIPLEWILEIAEHHNFAGGRP